MYDQGMLKALKGYVSRAACDPYGCLLLCVAIETIDDTVLVRIILVHYY